MAESSSSIKSDLHNLATGTTLAFGGAVLGNGVSYLFGVIVGRSLGAETLGLYFLALTLMQLANAVCRVGLPEGLLRFVPIALGRGDISRVWGTALSATAVVTLTSIVTATVLFLCAEPLSVSLFKQPKLVVYLRWFALSLPFFSLFIIMTTLIQALKRMDLVVLSRDLLQPIIMLSLALILFHLVWESIISFLAAYTISMAFALIASTFFCWCSYSRFEKHDRTIFEWKILLAFSLPITASDLSYYLFRWVDTFLLSIFRTASEMGIYNAALRTTLLLNLLAVSVNSLYAPIVADHHQHKRYQEIEDILKTVTRWCLTLALPIVALIIMLSGEILAMWGTEFVSGTTVLIVLAVSQLMFIIGNLLAFTLLMGGKQYLEVGNTLLVTVINIMLNLALIPKWGMNGAAVSVLVSRSLALALRLAEVRYLFGVRLYTMKYMKPLIALLPISLVVFALRSGFGEVTALPFMGSHFATMMVIFSFVASGYVIVLYLLGFEKEDLTIWRGLRAHKASLTS